MSKLKVKQTYSKRCLYGDHIIGYLLRDTNLNTEIKDEDIYHIAGRNMGKIESEYCEDCKKMTAQMTVAYGVEQV